MPSETVQIDHDISETSEFNQSSYQKNEVTIFFENLGRNCALLIVKGESMLPNFAPGDVIVVDPTVKPTPGRFVIAMLYDEDSATFKKYLPKGFDDAGNEIIELAAVNPEWPSLYISSENPGRIIGTIVEHRRAV